LHTDRGRVCPPGFSPEFIQFGAGGARGKARDPGLAPNPRATLGPWLAGGKEKRGAPPGPLIFPPLAGLLPRATGKNRQARVRALTEGPGKRGPRRPGPNQATWACRPVASLRAAVEGRGSIRGKGAAPPPRPGRGRRPERWAPNLPSLGPAQSTGPRRPAIGAAERPLQ